MRESTVGSEGGLERAPARKIPMWHRANKTDSDGQGTLIALSNREINVHKRSLKRMPDRMPQGLSSQRLAFSQMATRRTGVSQPQSRPMPHSRQVHTSASPMAAIWKSEEDEGTRCATLPHSRRGRLEPGGFSLVASVSNQFPEFRCLVHTAVEYKMCLAADEPVSPDLGFSCASIRRA